MSTAVVGEHSAPSRPPRRTSRWWYVAAWWCTFQVTGRAILTTRYYLDGPEDSPQLARALHPLEITLSLVHHALGVLATLLIGLLAIIHLRRKPRLRAERVFFVAMALIAASVVYESIRYRTPLEVSLGVEWARSLVAWISRAHPRYSSIGASTYDIRRYNGGNV